MIHPVGCECDVLGCKMRREGVFAVPLTPMRRGKRPYRDPVKYNHNSWEAGVAGERRADGSFMPYLGDTGRIHVKEYSEKRTSLDRIRRDQISAPSNEKAS